MDESVPSHRDAPASSSREPASEPRVKVVSRASTVLMRTMIARLASEPKRPPCRKRTCTALPRAEKFGDLITADHKVLSEGCESRNNHRHAVVVQDLATEWIQSYPCKTQTSQETEKRSRKFLEPSEKPKVISTDKFPTIWQSL